MVVLLSRFDEWVGEKVDWACKQGRSVGLMLNIRASSRASPLPQGIFGDHNICDRRGSHLWE
ncbi:hypothetical protein EMIT0P294_11268 [Pseudomonas sp. IT-P294]